MQLGAFDWLLAGCTVAIGLVLLAAPLTITPKLRSLYSLHGALETAPTHSRLMLSTWAPPLMVLLPTAMAVSCTVSHMRPRRRRAVLLLSLILALAVAAGFIHGLLAPILSAASGAD